jgi:hypothetical protein
MKINYKDFEINCTREKSLGGENLLYYQIYDKDGVEVVGSFTTDASSVRVYANSLKEVVDDIIENPNEYYEDPFDDTFECGCCRCCGCTCEDFNEDEEEE